MPLALSSPCTPRGTSPSTRSSSRPSHGVYWHLFRDLGAWLGSQSSCTRHPRPLRASWLFFSPLLYSPPLLDATGFSCPLDAHRVAAHQNTCYGRVVNKKLHAFWVTELLHPPMAFDCGEHLFDEYVAISDRSLGGSRFLDHRPPHARGLNPVDAPIFPPGVCSRQWPDSFTSLEVARYTWTKQGYIGCSDAWDRIVTRRTGLD
jgi:hypothetical protein